MSCWRRCRICIGVRRGDSVGDNEGERCGDEPARNGFKRGEAWTTGMGFLLTMGGGEESRLPIVDDGFLLMGGGDDNSLGPTIMPASPDEGLRLKEIAAAAVAVTDDAFAPPATAATAADDAEFLRSLFCSSTHRSRSSKYAWKKLSC